MFPERLNHKWLHAAIATIGLAALPLFAAIDLRLASYFYDETCQCFPAAALIWLHRFDGFIAWAGRLATPVMLTLILFFWWRSSGDKQVFGRLQVTARYRRSIRALGFMLALGVLTPLLLIHEVIKPEIGRARPRDIESFAGSQAFTPAWVRSTACTRNCSFTSGHAAFGAWVMSAWYVGRRRRGLWLGLAGALTVVIGWSRMAQGAHFFSDVIGSLLLVWLTAQVLAALPYFRSRS
ncbi:MAG: phosphatase PAP2 family protein [Betaproteobacteria bacterium]|jgi:lipid A 4'-phosphatase|nr:phosphatase PAP2 family protein [Betaproteobacteria bacterium]NDC85753.1 phosphatase PAP2 family protein [Betaproteobacteria bacterium]NDG81236.1 phosphatase PAP2 family protein [Betaproteobacteria bacterium]